MQLSKSEAQSLRQTIPFTPEQLSEMAEMYAKTRSLRVVGERFGINRNAVRSRLAAQGVEILPFERQPILHGEQLQEVMRKLDAGASVSEMAFQYDVHESTINKALIRAGRTPRRRSR